MAQVDKSRILDVAKWQPPTRTRMVRNEKGVPIPGMFHERWLSPAGNVVALGLGNANARAEGSKTAYYEQQKAFKLNAHRSMKLPAGWVPWGRCPVAMVMSQEIGSSSLANKDLLLDSPCVPDISKPFSPENPCKHAVIERDHRLALNAAVVASKEESYKRDGERDRDQRDVHHKETIEALTKGQSGQADVLKTLLEKLVADGQSAEKSRK
jgi:hypothetical protein